MYRLCEKNGWEDISDITYITFMKKFENFKMIVMKHISEKTWTLSLEDYVDIPEIDMRNPDEVIIDEDVTYEFVHQFDLLMSNFKNYMRNEKMKRIKY